MGHPSFYGHAFSHRLVRVGIGPAKLTSIVHIHYKNINVELLLTDEYKGNER